MDKWITIINNLSYPQSRNIDIYEAFMTYPPIKLKVIDRLLISRLLVDKLVDKSKNHVDKFTIKLKLSTSKIKGKMIRKFDIKFKK